MSTETIKLNPELKAYIGGFISLLVMGFFILWYGYSLVPNVILWGTLSIVGTIGLVYGQKKYLERITYTITDTKIMYDRDMFGTEHKEFNIDKIQTSDLKQSFFQKLLGDFGTVRISTAGSEGSDITIRGVGEIHEVVKIINRKQNDKYENDKSSQTESTTINAIEEAKQLRETSNTFKNLLLQSDMNTQGDNYDE